MLSPTVLGQKAKINHQDCGMAIAFEVCHLFRRLQEIGQFSGLLAKCLEPREPGYYITVAYEC